MPFDTTSWSASSSARRARASASSAVGGGSPAPRRTRRPPSRAGARSDFRAILHDLSAGRVGRRPGDVRQLHRLRVDERRVTAGVRQHHRDCSATPCRATRGGEILRRSAAGMDGPLLLMPAAPDNPLSRPGVRDRPRDRLDDLVPARRAHQVEVHLVLADAGEVPVALDETRHREPGVQLDHFRRRSDIAVRFRQPFQWRRSVRPARRAPRPRGSGRRA